MEKKSKIDGLPLGKPINVSRDSVFLAADRAGIAERDRPYIFHRARNKTLVRARMAVVRELRIMGYSFSGIGRALGIDHTSVMYLAGQGAKTTKEN